MPLRVVRCLRVGLLLVAGALVVLTVFPLCRESARLRLLRDWSAALLDALGVDLDADSGSVPPGALLVANHISWLDIFVINAALPAVFVAKAEVRNWPLIGWLAARNGTVFLRRGSRGHARIVNAEIAGLLSRGRHVAIFPEGTTSDGRCLLHFHAALLQPALAVGRPVVPVALSYWEKSGERSLAPRYDGDVSLAGSARAIISSPGLSARLVALPPCGMAGEDRRTTAAAARAAIASGAGLPLASNPPGTPAGLPA